MRVSAKSDYALRALIAMTERSDGRAVSAEELGRLQDIPPTASSRRSSPTSAAPAS